MPGGFKGDRKANHNVGEITSLSPKLGEFSPISGRFFAPRSRLFPPPPSTPPPPTRPRPRRCALPGRPRRWRERWGTSSRGPEISAMGSRGSRGGHLAHRGERRGPFWWVCLRNRSGDSWFRWGLVPFNFQGNPSMCPKANGSGGVLRSVFLDLGGERGRHG